LNIFSPTMRLGKARAQPQLLSTPRTKITFSTPLPDLPASLSHSSTNSLHADTNLTILRPQPSTGTNDHNNNSQPDSQPPLSSVEPSLDDYSMSVLTHINTHSGSTPWIQPLFSTRCRQAEVIPLFSPKNPVALAAVTPKVQHLPGIQEKTAPLFMQSHQQSRQEGLDVESQPSPKYAKKWDEFRIQFMKQHRQ